MDYFILINTILFLTRNFFLFNPMINGEIDLMSQTILKVDNISNM